jgi:hypothetical protein
MCSEWHLTSMLLGLHLDEATGRPRRNDPDEPPSIQV